MAERRATNEEALKEATYQVAGTLRGGDQHADVSEGLRQRTVVTSRTQGSLVLRYAPRSPKAAASIDTNS